MLYQLTALAACSVLLTGCANVQKPVTPPVDPAVVQAQESKAIVVKVATGVEQATAKVVETTGNKSVVSDPTLVPFDKMSAKLTPSTEQQVRALAPALVIAKQITVTGYCDRREVGNAPAAAKARAETVKKLLVENGIAANRIVTKIDTQQRLHAVRVTFNG
ncbi:OmpA family protein [Vogesella sp. LIG4]|uniref:OmpA family protein n=1 Tax=Vogesella sp. LIG4 TaxID=1192162 RepID=UPI00081FB94A|nr:OmpA family protein [Vogesella sp. LIG4]SCK08689.1 Outer membrane protein OmpA [Vogesella sp. LIG4]